MRARLIAFLLCLLPGLALAQSYPQPTSDTVNDFADLLTAEEESTLAGQLKAARKETGVHVVVATIPSRESVGFGETALEPFATGLFNAWGIGDKKRNDGVLILVLPEDREMRVELGSGFPSSFDSVAQQIIDNEFLPEFKRGNYSRGIKTGTSAVITHIAGGLSGKGAAPLLYKPKSGGSFFIWVVLGGIGLGAVFVVSQVMLLFQRCVNCGKRGLQRTVVTLEHASEYSSGREEVTTFCPSCGHREVHTRTVPPRDRNRSSGSSGGFGGGRSSGGGASGRW